MFRRSFHATARALQKQTKDQATNNSRTQSKPAGGFISRLKDCYTPSSEYFIFAFMNTKLGAKQRFRSFSFFAGASAFVLLEDRYAPWGTGGEIKLWPDSDENFMEMVVEAFSRRQKSSALHEPTAS